MENQIDSCRISSFFSGPALLESGGFNVILLNIQMERLERMEDAGLHKFARTDRKR
ncbi:MAG: hypothetical protein K2P49_06310 [Oscillospiraceae bacterium]|nr:hypothetical protein [Oscillospiraceae bacterium]